MFESAELGHKIKKSVYGKEVPSLREALLEVQLLSGLKKILRQGCSLGRGISCFFNQ